MRKPTSTLGFYSLNTEEIKSGPLTFAHFFTTIFKNGANRVFSERYVNEKLVSLTFKEVETIIISHAKQLKIRLAKYRQGSFVGLLISDNHSLIIDFWATLMAGFVPLMMNPHYADSINEEILNGGDVEVLISDTVHQGFGALTILSNSLEDNYSAENFLPTWADEIALCSSGSQATPHICVFKEKAVLKQSLTNAKNLRTDVLSLHKMYKKDFKALVMLPFFHIFGLFTQFFIVALCNFTYVFPKSLNSESILSAIKDQRVTLILGVPMFFNAVADGIEQQLLKEDVKTQKKFARGLELSEKLQKNGSIGSSEFVKNTLLKKVSKKVFGPSVKFCICGGSQVKEKTMRLLNGLGYSVVNGYGSSEMGIVAVQRSNKFVDRVSLTIGQPFDGVRVELDSTNKEIIVHSDTGAYKTIAGGVERVLTSPFRTGDVGSKDDSGCISIVSRLDDLIIGPNGENISPDLMETVFSIKTAKHVSIINYRNKLSLLLYYPEGLTLNGYNDVIDNLRNNPETAKYLNAIYIADAPLLEPGSIKVRRNSLSGRIDQGLVSIVHLSDYEIDFTDKYNIIDSELMVRIINVFSKYSSRKIKPQHDFFYTLGGTSLDYYSLLLDMSEEFSINFDSTKGSLHTPFDFYKLIQLEREVTK